MRTVHCRSLVDKIVLHNLIAGLTMFHKSVSFTKYQVQIQLDGKWRVFRNVMAHSPIQASTQPKVVRAAKLCHPLAGGLKAVEFPR